MIDMNKKYRTRSGLPARVLCVDRKDKTLPVVFMVLYEQREALCCSSINGRYTSEKTESEWDLVEISPYDGFKIDEPVMVRDYDTGIWHRRYFAGVTPNGKAKTWNDGRTSWSMTMPLSTVTWQHCRRPTPEELADVKV